MMCYNIYVLRREHKHRQEKGDHMDEHMTQLELENFKKLVAENQLLKVLNLIQNCETADEVRQIIKALLTSK